MKLVLFDIDGILVKSGQISVSVPSIRKHFGIEINPDDVYPEGKTDRAILAERLEKAGIKDPEKDKRFEETLRDYGNIIGELIQNIKIEQIPNVENLIKTLIKEGCAIGLLTGNTPKKAQAKLKNAGLWHYFNIGAFGYNTKIRSELVDIAIKDAKEKTGIEFNKKDVYIIGDTIRDIMCAKEGNVRSIAVATGKESLDILKKENPDHLFQDFTGIKKILDVLK